MDEVSKIFTYAGMKREEMKKQVEAAEKDAAVQLGGPVVRTHKFTKGMQGVVFTWRRAS